MIIEDLRSDLVDYINKHNLTKKWEKAKKLFEEKFNHPSLNTELLEPHRRGIFSFRIDRQYRSIFFITKQNTAEIITITNHYKK